MKSRRLLVPSLYITRFIVCGKAAAYPNKGIQIEGTFLNFNMGCIDNPWYL